MFLKTISNIISSFITNCDTQQKKTVNKNIDGLNIKKLNLFYNPKISTLSFINDNTGAKNNPK